MKTKNLIHSFKCAYTGLVYGLKTERNIKIHFLTMLLVILLGLICQITKTEWCICLLLFGNVISLEYINTALEKIVDMYSPTKNELARIAKDVAAASVLVVASVSLIIGVLLFLPKIIEIIF